MLDRGLRCVELPSFEETLESGETTDPASPLGPSDRIHLFLLESLFSRMLADRPAVSVVIPLYNTPADYLRETIQSVLDQDSPDWELVLVDNGDPEITAPVVREFSDPRIRRYFSHMGRRGVAMGRNLGNLLARGYYIAVMDHDDICYPDRVSTIKSEFSKKEGFLYSDIMFLYPDGSKELKKLSHKSFDKPYNIVFNTSIAYPWSFATEHPYDPRFEPVDDYRFKLYCIHKKKRFIHVDRPLINYRWHSGQYSRKAKLKMKALEIPVRDDNHYLREGNDPLDKQKRFERTVLFLLAYGFDKEARELLETGYGPAHLKKAMAETAMSGNEESCKGSIEDVLLEDPAADRVRQGIWLTLHRSGPESAIKALEAGLSRDRLSAREMNDLADMLIRTGELERAEQYLDLALQQGGHLCLPVIQQFLEGLWKTRLGPESAPLPVVRPAGQDKTLSVIIASQDQDQASLYQTLQSLAEQKYPLEIVLNARAMEQSFLTEFSGMSFKTFSCGSSLPGAEWNHGIEEAGGKYIAFLRAGDTWSLDFAAKAVQTFHSDPEAEVFLGQVNVDKKTKLPGRNIGLSHILKDERSLLCGCVLQAKCLEQTGGFIPGLEQAASWEFMVRVIKGNSVYQSSITAGDSFTPPFLGWKGADKERFRREYELSLLVKYLHWPLRYMDYAFSGPPPAWFEQRFSELDRITRRHKELIPFLDPWEYFRESNTSYYLLYRLGRRLHEQKLYREARAAFFESIRIRPNEPKTWARLIKSMLRVSS